MARTTMLHVRVDEDLKAEATKTLAKVGLTVSEAVRILLTRVRAEGGLPAGLTSDTQTHDAWFRMKVQEALADTRQGIPHEDAMRHIQAMIQSKRNGED